MVGQTDNNPICDVSGADYLNRVPFLDICADTFSNGISSTDIIESNSIVQFIMTVHPQTMSLIRAASEDY